MSLHYETAVIVSIIWFAICCAVFIVTHQRYTNKCNEILDTLDNYKSTVKMVLNAVIEAQQKDLKKYTDEVEIRHSVLKEVFKNE